MQGKQNQTKQKQWIGWILAIAISIISGLALLNVSFEFILLIIILLSVSLLFLVKDQKTKAFFRRNKYLLAIFIIISTLVLGVLISSGLLNKNFHEGSVYYETSAPSQTEGYILGGNEIPNDYIQIPEDYYFYRLNTDEFGFTSFEIFIEFYQTRIDSVVGFMWYYFDNHKGDAVMYNETITFTVLEKEEMTLCFANISFISSQSSSESINYLFKFLVKPQEESSLDPISSKIEFNSNIKDIKYSYTEVRNLPIEGGFFGDTLQITEGLGLVPSPTLLIAGFVILISYILIVGLSFVWQKFDIASFIFILYFIIGFILLFWYVTWGMENPTEIIQNEWFAVEWRVKGAFGDDIVNMESLRYFIIALVAILQWVFSIGNILLIMLLITKTFSTIFNPIPSEISNIKLQLSDLMDKVGGGN